MDRDAEGNGRVMAERQKVAHAAFFVVYELSGKYTQNNVGNTTSIRGSVFLSRKRDCLYLPFCGSLMHNQKGERPMILETERLRLKPYEQAFADAIYEVVKHKEIADTMIMIPHPYPRDVVDSWIDYLKHSFENGSAYEFAVFLKEDDRYIGNCGLVAVSKNHRNAEVGYFIDVAEWGKGYATEACKRIIDYGFKEHQLNRIYSRCMVRNTASRKVMEKSGMRYEGRHRQEFLKDDVYEDMDYLAILAEDVDR